MKRIGLIGLIAAVVCLSVVLVAAQEPQPPQQPGPPPQQPGPAPQQPGPPPPPDLGDAMFPPDMIMQHQRELGLTDEQKTLMRGEINKTSARFNDLQWQLQDAMEALHETMKSNNINEQQALAQLDKVLDAEREIKKLHMGLAIRIKNNLTAEQQTKLQNLRHGPGPGGPRHGPGGPDGPGAPGGPRAPRPGGPGGPGRPGGPGGAPPGNPRPNEFDL